MDGLVEAMLEVGSGLELRPTLKRIVGVARKLVHARYGALGVLAPGGGLAEFLCEGFDERVCQAIGGMPTGRGLLGVVPARAAPLRLDELSAHPAAEGFPEHHPALRSLLSVPVLVRDEVFGVLHLSEKEDGAAFTEADEVVLQALAAAAGIAVENARRYEELRARERWREAAAEIRSALLVATDSKEVLNLIAARARDLAEADYAFIALADDPELPAEEVPELVVRVCAGLDAGALTGRAIPIQGSTCGEVFRGKAPRRVPALTYDLATGTGAAFGAALVLPLRAGDSVTGVLAALRARGGRPFGPELLPLMASFADQAALALQLAGDQRRQRELDLLADRERIARDLHDHVIQRVFAIGLSLQSTQQRSRSPEIQVRIGEIVDELQELVRVIRTAIFDLHDGAQGGGQLRKRLHEVIAELTGDAGLRSTVRMSGPLSVVPAALADHAEAVVREAVSNVVRHARATTVNLTVSVADDLAIVVTDNGVGIPDSAARSGLHNLVQRADAAGGRMAVTKVWDGGTRLAWSAPLP